MGNSISCFDPVREHPPYSWPKDHPDRNAAIAEIKRKRKNQKIVGAQGSARTIDVDPTHDIAAAEAEKKAEEERLKKEQEMKKAEEAAKLRAEEDARKAEEERAAEEAKKRAEEDAAAAEAAIKAEEEAKQKAEEEAILKAEEEAKKAEEEAKRAEEAAAATATATAIAEAEKNAEEERIKAEEEAKKIEEAAKLRAEEEASEAEEKARLAAETEAAAATAERVAALDAKETPEASSSIDDRRAMFDQSQDTLPEAKDLVRDVLDPVTNEYITLEEYRRRQKERAQGVVKERVELLEKVDDETSKQKAEFAAIEAARAEAQQKADWKYKHEGDTTETDGDITTFPILTTDEVVESCDPVEPIDDTVEAVETPDVVEFVDAVETPEVVETVDIIMEDVPGHIKGSTDVVQTFDTVGTVDPIDEVITKIPEVPTEMPMEVDGMETMALENSEMIEATGMAPAPVI